MTEKSLGQVLYESLTWRRRPWAETTKHEREAYEYEASAVATVVREQCAQAGMAVCWTDKQAEIVGNAIRSMK